MSRAHSSAAHNALHDQRTWPQIPQPGEVIPADGMPGTRNLVLDIPQASLRWPAGTARRQQPSCVHEVGCPGWMGGSLKKESRFRRNWRLHVVPGITVAYTRHRAVHRDAENFVVQSERPAYETLGMFSGRPYVQLEPHGAIRGPGQLLRSPGNAAEAVNSARVRGSPRGDALGVVVDEVALLPPGPRMTGSDILVPSAVVVRSRRETSTSGLGRST